MVILLLPLLIAGFYIIVLAYGAYVVQAAFGQVLSPQALLLSQPATGLTAFNPKHYLPAVLQMVNSLEFSALIPSLPDWDQ